MSLPRLAMLGVAHMHAHGYAQCLRQLGIPLVGVYDHQPGRSKEFAEQFGSRAFEDAETLLTEQLDGVIVCSENVYHRPLVELAAANVAAILCEKPIATTLEDARAMIDTCQQYGSRLQIAFPVRFAPPVERLKQQLDDGLLGGVTSVVATNHGRMPGGWFIQPSLAGGGAVMDHTVHVIDLLRWFWQTEVTSMYAEIGSSLLHDIDIDDAGLLSFTLANGVYGTLDTSWSRPANYPTWGDVKLELLGERGIIRVDAFRQHLTLTAATGVRYLGWGSNADMGLVQDFLKVVQGREPSITGTDGLKALEVALAAYQSAATKDVVQLG
jgi:predicted dehydrogenase